MPQFTISVTKSTAFRDSVQEFSNVYTYAGIGTMPSEAEMEALIDTIVTEEKKFHSTQVNFKRGRGWSSGGTKEENQMIADKVLTGQGAAATITSFDRERAVLVQWPAGVNNLGRPVFLRKWYHPCGQFGTVSFPSTAMDNTQAIPLATRTTIEGYVDPLTRIGTLEDWGLVADSGRERTGDGDPVAHKYLEHHQFGDMWRG